MEAAGEKAKVAPTPTFGRLLRALTRGKEIGQPQEPVRPDEFRTLRLGPTFPTAKISSPAAQARSGTSSARR